MADPRTPLAQWRAIVLKLFPWAARFGLASSGALQIKSAAARTEIEGGGPAALRVGDCGWLLFDPGVISLSKPPILYYSTQSPLGPWTPVSTVSIPGSPPVPFVDSGTQIAPNGSKKVQIG